MRYYVPPLSFPLYSEYISTCAFHFTSFYADVRHRKQRTRCTRIITNFTSMYQLCNPRPTGTPRQFYQRRQPTGISNTPNSIYSTPSSILSTPSSILSTSSSILSTPSSIPSTPSNANSEFVPLLFVLMPNKKMWTYLRVLKMIKRAVGEIKAEQVNLDFEKAAISAWKKVYPNIQLHGFYFHLNQAINP